tara:strand:- start:6372 stop:6923 length:552 start_codon:yes stop_codon:yes gene_type:complete
LKNVLFTAVLLTISLINSFIAQPKEKIDMAKFTISSSEFKNSHIIPSLFTCEGKDISPPLKWLKKPEGTKSFVLTCVDPDAPVGTWVHWICWNIPAGTLNFNKNIPSSDQKSMTQGMNSWGRIGYNGPCPPPGHGPHRYIFTLFALDLPELSLKSSSQWWELKRAMDGHILGKTKLMGKYERK